MKKVTPKSKRGGKRAGAGRKPGKTKEKITISVDATALKTGLKKSGGGRSALFNGLLTDYVAGGKATPSKQSVKRAAP